MASYTIAHKAQLEDYAAASSSILTSDDTGLIVSAPYSTEELTQRVGMSNRPMFSVWTVPPQDMSINGPSTQGTYVINNWRTESGGSVPPEATVLHYGDASGGALDLATGNFTIARSGIYRHSMYLRMNSSSNGNYGLFLRINGMRHVGDFRGTPADVVFRDSLNFATEMWHEAGEVINFIVVTTFEDGSADGIFASWTVSLVFDGAEAGTPGGA